MSRKAADYTDRQTDKKRISLQLLIRVYPWLGSALSVELFNNVVYQNQSFGVTKHGLFKRRSGGVVLLRRRP